LGVAHLAEKLVTEIKKNQSYLDITPTDILCVKVAGLCHDLGHGPFSHVFDGVFMKRMHPHGIPSSSPLPPSSTSNTSHNDDDDAADIDSHINTTEKSNLSNGSSNHNSQSSGKQSSWRHEEGSVQMFNHILQVNDINILNYGLYHRDKEFIEEMIRGAPLTERRGRDPNKYWLYDIVSNVRSGLDVDKLDYLLRDMSMANVVFASSFGRYDLGRC
jgi:HD superfamily phosphohydrolase